MTPPQFCAKLFEKVQLEIVGYYHREWILANSATVRHTRPLAGNETMSTERKPGSRGVKEPFGHERVNPTPPIGTEPGTREKPKSKGTTKTVSPRQSYKKRKPRK